MAHHSLFIGDEAIGVTTGVADVPAPPRSPSPKLNPGNAALLEIFVLLLLQGCAE